MWQTEKQSSAGRRGLGLAAVAALLVVAGLGVAGIKSHPGATKGDTAMPVAAAAPGTPASLADLAEHVAGSVVNIKVTKVERTGGMTSFGSDGAESEAPFGDFMQKFFGGRMPQEPRERKQQGAGSGFIISKEGYILTNNHVVEDATEVTVTLADKQEYPAKLIGRDPKTDIAVVKIEPTETLTVASLGDSDALRVGDSVMAVGNPFGLSNTVTKGIVSAKHRVIGAGPYDDFLQTDAPINPGNSGGPLFNMRGEVVGINTAIVPNGQGIGFAVAVNLAKSLIPQLESQGEVTRGYLGVQLQELTPELAKGLGMKDSDGVLVAEVTTGSPAETAGIKRGDVIVKYDGKEVAALANLPAQVAATPVDKAVPVTVLRDGTLKTVSVQIGRMPGERAAVASQNDSAAAPQGKWGLALRDLDARTAQQAGVAPGDGVLVATVTPDSPAERAGLRPGDVLVEVNRTKVTSVAEAQAQAQKADGALLVLVKRGNASLFAALEQK